MKIIGIVGARVRNNRADFKAVEAALRGVYEEGDWICSGGCSQGADAFALTLARREGITYLEFPPNWRKHGKAAGFVRNSSIAKHSHVLIACVSPERKGGTEDTILKFRKEHPEGKVLLV